MVSLLGLHRFVGPSANRDPKRSHSRGPGDGRWFHGGQQADGRPKILRKTQNTKHFNTSTLPVLGHKKEWHTQKDTLGPAICVPHPPPKKKQGAIQNAIPIGTKQLVLPSASERKLSLMPAARPQPQTPRQANNRSDIISMAP